LPEAGEEDLARCAARISMALAWAGLYRAALDLAQAQMDRDSGLGVDHAAVLLLRTCRASAQQFLGRHAEAEAGYRQRSQPGTQSA
jgi:hypothetical protein